MFPAGVIDDALPLDKPLASAEYENVCTSSTGQNIGLTISELRQLPQMRAFSTLEVAHNVPQALPVTKPSIQLDARAITSCNAAIWDNELPCGIKLLVSIAVGALMYSNVVIQDSQFPMLTLKGANALVVNLRHLQ